MVKVTMLELAKVAAELPVTCTHNEGEARSCELRLGLLRSLN